MILFEAVATEKSHAWLMMNSIELVLLILTFRGQQVQLVIFRILKWHKTRC